jgi:hypothetical protein
MQVIFRRITLSSASESSRSAFQTIERSATVPFRPIPLRV